MKKTKTKSKVIKTKVKGPKFIRFSKVQTRYLFEVRTRQLKEWNEALESVYQEIGIIEKILQAQLGTYSLRQDYSGLDVLSVSPRVEEKKKPEKKPALPEELASQDILEEKNKKDN